MSVIWRQEMRKIMMREAKEKGVMAVVVVAVSVMKLKEVKESVLEWTNW